WLRSRHGAPRLAALRKRHSALLNDSHQHASWPNIMNTDLRLTDTNAASDSQGRTWGLEGNLFWYLVGGLGAGITTFFVLIVIMKAGLLSSFGIALLPVVLVLAYIYGLRQGKPPGYDR